MPRPHLHLFAVALFAAVTVPALAAQQPAAPAPASTASSAPAAAVGPYHIVDRWKIGGEGGWDYLIADPGAHRLYLAHGMQVDVVDTTSGKLIGSITGLHGVHGVALDPAGKFGYISDGGGNAVVVFDRSTLAAVATIPAGTNPDCIIFEPVTKTVWAFNGRSSSITVIDPSTRTVVATIPIPGKPEFAVADGQGNVFDNLEDKSEIVRIDAHAKSVLGTWPAGCDSPSGLAFDAAGHRLFPVCDGKKMSVIDSTTGKLLANPSIGDGPDAAGYSAAHSLAFASSRDGILSVIDAAAPDYPTIESLPTQPGARTMAYDPSTDRVYLVTAEFGPRPDPTPQNPRPRPPVLPGSFTVIVVGR
ncbi:MAG TPA: YncE family protein [Terracidiphilus sp.]|nr:YncE family protein [Terracidiphilus sp.]